VNELLVHIVDDDPAVRDSLYWLLKSRKVASALWSDGSDFLSNYSPEMSGCIILDIRMPGMSGIELFDRLRLKMCMLPVIFLTGHGDVPMAVRAIKEGAFDFLEKPFDDNALVDRVLAAFAHDTDRRIEQSKSSDTLSLLGKLTLREHEVMDRILLGQLNKVIADELGIAMRTVEVHRARIFEKMEVRSAVELARLLSDYSPSSVTGISIR
jgi:two-component system response regulator DctR